MSSTISVERTLRDFEGCYIDDGYGFIEAGNAAGWRAVSSWGRDGWDLGDWPYLVYMFRGDTERASYCEGDICIETFPSREARELETDDDAFRGWKRNEESWVEGIEPGSQPENLRGPFSWARLDAQS